MVPHTLRGYKEMKMTLLQEETSGTVADVEDGECLSDGESESQVRYPAPRTGAN